MNITMALNYMSFSRPVPMASMTWGRAQNMSQAEAAPQAAGGPAGYPNAPGSQKVWGQPDYDTYECQTCKNRKYQDGSNDLGVSFKTPTSLTPEKAAYAVRAHESEHVARAWAQAQREDKEIVSQSVTYRTGVCPECGKTYIAGGSTQTVFRSAPETYEKAPAEKGKYLDILA